jgi:hypothetical protein
MLKNTELRDAAYNWMERRPSGAEFTHADTYHFLETNFPTECSQRGDATREPRYKNDARWAIQDALGETAGKAKIVEKLDRSRFRRL